jgi:hypothetical protein
MLVDAATLGGATRLEVSYDAGRYGAPTPESSPSSSKNGQSPPVVMTDDREEIAEGFLPSSSSAHEEAEEAASPAETPAWVGEEAVASSDDAAWQPTGRDGKTERALSKVQSGAATSALIDSESVRLRQPSTLSEVSEVQWVPTGRDGKMERTYPDGRREVLYRNGTRKEVIGPISVR